MQYDTCCNKKIKERLFNGNLVNFLDTDDLAIASDVSFCNFLRQVDSFGSELKKLVAVLSTFRQNIDDSQVASLISKNLASVRPKFRFSYLFGGDKFS